MDRGNPLHVLILLPSFALMSAPSGTTIRVKTNTFEITRLPKHPYRQFDSEWLLLKLERRLASER